MLTPPRIARLLATTAVAAALMWVAPACEDGGVESVTGVMPQLPATPSGDDPSDLVQTSAGLFSDTRSSQETPDQPGVCFTRVRHFDEAHPRAFRVGRKTINALRGQSSHPEQMAVTFELYLEGTGELVRSARCLIPRTEEALLLLRASLGRSWRLSNASSPLGPQGVSGPQATSGDPCYWNGQIYECPPIIVQGTPECPYGMDWDPDAGSSGACTCEEGGGGGGVYAPAPDSTLSAGRGDATGPQATEGICGEWEWEWTDFDWCEYEDECEVGGEGGGGGGGSGNGGSGSSAPGLDLSDDEVDYEEPPDCDPEYIELLPPEMARWCTADPISSEHLQILQNEIPAILQRCPELSDHWDGIQGNIRTFTVVDEGFAGGAQRDGDWMLISTQWLEHQYPEIGLAHELLHIDGIFHGGQPAQGQPASAEWTAFRNKELQCTGGHSSMESGG